MGLRDGRWLRMARPLRYEAAGAVYHVMARGDGVKNVFEDDKDRFAWTDLLARAHGRFGWRVHAWVLMGILIAKNYCRNGIVWVWNSCRCAGKKKSDSGAETPVPALFLGRGCSSTPSSRLGPGASALGLSAIFFGNQYNHSTFCWKRPSRIWSPV